MSTKERLVKALREAGAPDVMIKNAETGKYDDFESDNDMPISCLVMDARMAGLGGIVERAIKGEFDASTEEAQAWFDREGKGLI